MNNKLPDLVLGKEIVSGDTNNTVLVWPESGIPRQLYSGGNNKKYVSHVSVSFVESLVYVTEGQGSLLCFDTSG